ncbi:MAG: hypothetical protein ABWX63_03155 [Paeniglutamicibacter terrestris]
MPEQKNYAILVVAIGQLTDTATFSTSPPGLKRAIAWIDRLSERGRTPAATSDFLRTLE